MATDWFLGMWSEKEYSDLEDNEYLLIYFLLAVGAALFF